MATGNPGKLQEYRELLPGLPLHLVSPADLGLQDLDVAEDGDSLEANATQKARVWAAHSALPALADDTGLFVDALGGAPGIYPARWGGPGLSMAQRRRKLLDALGDTAPERRRARFVCVIAVAWGEHLKIARGEHEGQIAMAEMPGPAGFGYDSIFIPQGEERSWAQLPEDVKQLASHRSLAASRIIPTLRQLLRNLGAAE
ncbi:MAG: non-canonical purine NTP pyrophosphatase [Anaerolineaceae bacterium]|nr:non-canonical purine NTP pyrophosphatase [Anaerolineaceae bacterium]